MSVRVAWSMRLRYILTVGRVHDMTCVAEIARLASAIGGPPRSRRLWLIRALRLIGVHGRPPHSHSARMGTLSPCLTVPACAAAGLTARIRHGSLRLTSRKFQKAPRPPAHQNSRNIGA